MPVKRLICLMDRPALCNFCMYKFLFLASNIWNSDAERHFAIFAMSFLASVSVNRNCSSTSKHLSSFSSSYSLLPSRLTPCHLPHQRKAFLGRGQQNRPLVPLALFFIELCIFCCWMEQVWLGKGMAQFPDSRITIVLHVFLYWNMRLVHRS